MNKNDNSPDEIARLKTRIQSLEEELADRERDLATYREELQRANVKLEGLIAGLSSQLRLAGDIQRKLVPTDFPNIPGLEFSTKFLASAISGGDYFDIFEHDDRFRFGVVLASSSGYTMSSLFLSVLLRMSGRAEAKKSHSPHRLLEALAAELIPGIGGQETTSLFYAIVDRRTFQLSYCNLGQCVGLYFNAASGKLTRLAPNGPVLSRSFLWNAVNEAASVPVQLNPRDRFVFCSEGAIKVLNPNGESFGEERLYGAILAAPRQGVHELRNEIMFQIDKFAGRREIPQDITVVVGEVKDKIIKLA